MRLLTLLSNDNFKGKVMTQNLEKATLGGGCFWCTEAVFLDVIGVESVVSGYAGGENPNPTYQQICTGRTGHAEVVEIMFDPAVISYEILLEIFWNVHDPTTLNQQGADRGTQYRSVIFYHSEEQKEIAERSMAAAEAAGLWPNRFVTEISAAPVFYSGEAYHQEYYENNSNQPYCMVVIDPKLRKFRKKFQEKSRAVTG